MATEDVTEHFDAIFCLSVSKWVQLNWGDEGIKKMFHKVSNYICYCFKILIFVFVFFSVCISLFFFPFFFFFFDILDIQQFV